MNKVAIIGCGNVGMSYAYALVANKTNVKTLVLIDVNKQKAEGEALDLCHAAAYNSGKLDIYAGEYADLKDADIVCIAAGRNQEVGESREDLIDKNLAVYKSVVSQVKESGFNGIYLVATNPLDVMTYITLKLSNAPQNKVIGSGTVLDSARLRYLLSKKMDINAKNIHAYVIGEHGDSEFVPWSNVVVGLNNINHYITEDEKKEIESDVRNSAYEIIRKKGNTSYGIGMCLMHITNAIFYDSNSIFTVSVFNEQSDVCIALPCALGKNGISQRPFLNLNQQEEVCLQNSIDQIRRQIEKIKF